MLKIFMSVIAAVAAPAIAQATATPALVVHNATHKVEHLVGLRQIDAHFQDQFNSIQVQALSPAKPGDPVYKTTISEVPDASGKAEQVEILLDASAKALSFNIINGPASVNAPAWPDADALTLGEDGLHYLLDNVTQHADMKPYLNGLASLTLNPSKDGAGNLLAQVQMTAKDSTAVLDVYLKTDGSFVSYKITNP
jgi:hypothetical protein